MKRALAIFLAPALFVLAFAAIYEPMPTEAQANIPCYTQQGGTKHVAASGCEYEFRSGSTLDIQDGTTFAAGGDVSVGDDFTLGGDLVTTPGTTIVVTPGSTVTPLGAYVPLSSTGTVGTSAIAGPTAGRRITLVNVAATTITFTDTGTLKLTGNIALGQYDTLSLVGDGTNWLQLSTANN